MWTGGCALPIGFSSKMVTVTAKLTISDENPIRSGDGSLALRN
jgi:hypothetical protein